MPTFHYIAADINGKTRKGKLDAADRGRLVGLLAKQQLFLVECSEDAAQQVGTRLKSKVLADFNRELGTMLSSGISLVRSIEIMLQRELPPKTRVVFENLYRSLLRGVSISDSMAALSGAFPELEVNMFRAGEANGTLDRTALRMAEYYEKEYKLRNKIKSASTYPMVLLSLTVVVMILVFTLILPRFVSLYGDMELPKITQLVIGISKLFTDYFLYLLIGVLVLILALTSIFKLPAPRHFLDRLKLHLPIFGKLLRTIYTARFARTLSSLYASGLTILDALRISRGTIGNSHIARQFDPLIQDIQNGEALSASLKKIDGYDSKLASVVEVGEEAGRLEDMLLSVADTFDYDADQATSRLVSMLEPILIILMAVLIGSVMIATMLPIYSLYEQIGSY
ncbi:MAG: type II secretion system F family protein [Clostridiaceae bacterium]|nr:type II secretion system F family protein [Clostridiaceae bacterium]